MPLFSKVSHTFNLDYPVSPYVGNICESRVLILGANAGYDPTSTSAEFQNVESVRAYLARVNAPADADWSAIHRYYKNVNYGDMIMNGIAALVNACAYRSPRISEEMGNRALIRELPSCIFTRRWLREIVVPLASDGRILVVAKRPGLWEISNLRGARGIVFDPAPVSPQLSQSTLQAIRQFLGECA
jgi:hypothetical protein